MTPLLNRGARTRRAELLRQFGFDPASDPLLATPYDPVRHTVRFNDLPAELLDQLGAAEHYEEFATGPIVRRRVPLWVRQHGGYVLPNRLVPLVQQYFRRLAGQSESPPATPNVTAFPGVVDPLVPAALDAYGRAVVQPAAGMRISCLSADLLQASPGRLAAVVCPNRRAVGQLTRDLRQAGVYAKAFFDNVVDACPRPAVAVGTPAGLASPSAAVDHVDLVVVLDPAWFCGLAGIPLRMVSNLVTVPWLGLLPAGRSLTPLERDVVTAFFGPFRFELPTHGMVTRQVLFARQPVVLPAGQGFDRMVMALAGELAAPDRREAGGRFGVVRQAEGISGLVAVLAQDDAHRHALRRVQRLADRDQVRVVTPDELSRLAGVGILVRADRRPKCPPFSPAASVEPQLARRLLLIVDAIGPDDDRLARERAAEYRAENWVSLTAYRGGWVEWEGWLYRPLPGERISNSR
jgi:hypothetical protein